MIRLAKASLVLGSALLISGLSLSGCSGTKDALGLSKQAPDEFKVVKRAPLELPPDYSLRPPQPGAGRPQEMETDDQARKAVFGSETKASETRQIATSSERLLLIQAGADQANPNIRQIVDQETASLENRNKPVAQKLFGIGGDRNEKSATVVNSKEEAARIRKNLEDGKAVTDGETPYIEQ